ncbi:copG domain-containing protein [alpha proteobacterium U9-1i]|nr:copG domain-containing protein [alpha proteobacterium U9-1i]
MSAAKKKLTIYLESDLARALDLDARTRGLPTTRAAAMALRRSLLDEKDEAVADTVKMRLDRVEKREIIREREISIVKETLLLFIRVWLEHTPAPPEETLDATNAVAERRFNAFLELLAESMGPGQSLFAHAPHGQQDDRTLQAAVNGGAP